MNVLERPASALAAFIARGQFADIAVSSVLGAGTPRGELTFDDIAARVSLRYLDDGYVASAKKMSAVYIAVAAFENMLRELISSMMLEAKKDNWWEHCVSLEIRRRAQKRMDEEKEVRWHKSRGLSPIFYTDIDDLPNIIQQNWDAFEHTFQNIEWLRQIVRSVKTSRNVIMHSGELSLDDIERVGVNIRDFVRQVGV